MKTIKEYLQEWSVKISLPIEEVQANFDELVLEENQIHPDLTADERNNRALKRLGLSYKKQLRSPAVGFEGIVIGVGDVVDIVAKSRKEAINLFNSDPVLAVQQGVTNDDGIPLDTRKEWNDGRVNTGFGKPLPEHNYIRNIFGIAVKSKSQEDKPKFFSITISGEGAKNEKIEMFEPVRFMAIDKTNPDLIDKMYVLNASTFTEFKVDKKLQLPKFSEIVKSVCEGMYSELNNLTEYHNQNKENFNRIVITTGDVSSINPQPTNMGSRVLVLENEAMFENLESKGVTCWVPQRVNINFAEGSKIIVVGRTAQGKKKNSDGSLSEELGDVSINTYGIYPIPEYLISIPEEINPLSEDDIEI